ncbi:MAG: alpha-2-macroglobulin family protein, partial [Bacteroidetes bacterium]|nr:alpha-2-macroglobulin family protein [Bacteroidota bacterium]
MNYFMIRRRNTDWNEEGRVSGYNYDYYDLESYGNKIEEKEYETKDLSKYGNSKLLHINPDKLTQYKGVYLFVVTSLDENTYISDAKLVSVSDVGTIAKRSKDEIYVFANSIKTAEPLNGVKVKLMSTNNQVMNEATTNGDGVAVFKNLKSNIDFTPGMIYTYYQNDFNYMMFNDAEVQQSRFDVEGYRLNSSGLQTFIYGDRDLYRPGETIHTRYILRNDNWETPKNYPVKIKVLMPNGQEYKTVQQKLNDLGSTGLDIALSPSALTGTYTFEIFTANDVLLASKGISVEEFMPDRIEVKTKLNKMSYTISDSLNGTITARNLFGPPASNRNYEYEFRLSYKRFAPEQFKDYQFDLINNHYLNIDRSLMTGTTDKYGEAPVKYSFPQSVINTGLMEGMLFATVFDETGRPVHRSNTFDLYTQNVFIGAKQIDYWYNTQDRIKVPLVAVNKDGKSTSATVRVKLVQVEWFSWMTDGNNGYSIRSNGKEKVITDKMVNIGSAGNIYEFTPSFSGDYELRISLPGSDAYTAVRFSAWGWGSTSNSSFEVNNEGTITIEADKKEYKSGEDAKLLFKTPFSGKMLVTVEREKITEYHYITTDKKSASLTIKMKDEYCPNVYISAVLFHASDDGTMPLTVAHGYQSVKVDRPNLKLPLQIIAIDNTRSKKRQTVKVKTTAGSDAEVTLAIIDEGILNIKGYKTPDAYSFFYQRRALDVSSYDIYPFLMPDIGGKKSKTGGDAYMAQKEMDGRANPLANNRINLVAFWSGPLKLNAQGEASYTFDVPQFSGSLRIMALVHKGKGFGSAEKKLVVSDPIILSPSIPRFLSPGDTAYVPLMVTNTTKADISGVSSIKVSGNLVVKGPVNQNVMIKANGESRVIYKVYAQGMGQGHIDINYKTNSELYTNATDITIRPSAGLQKLADGGVLSGGIAKNVSFSSDFIPQYSKAKLVVSKSPMVQFAKNIDYLVHYPYGCVEQTISAAFPQMYFAELMPYMQNSKVNNYNAKYNVQEAIKKLNGMQLYNGAMSYWPGESYESHWGTAYAAHFLIEARKAGYEVNNQVIDRCIEYLKGKLQYKETKVYRIYVDNSWKEKSILSHEYAYSVYVMALDGKSDISSMNYMKNNKSMLTDEGLYMLAAAYATTGDIASYKSIIPSRIDNKGESLFGGSFYSSLREMAIALNV